MIDISSSMRNRTDEGETLFAATVQAAATAVREIVDTAMKKGLELEIRVDTFNQDHQPDVARLELSKGQPYADELAAFTTALLTQEVGGGTAYHDAMKARLEELGADDRKTFLVVATDGDDIHSQHKPADVAKAARAAPNVRLLVIGADDIGATHQRDLAAAAQASKDVNNTSHNQGAELAFSQAAKGFRRTSSACVGACFRDVSQGILSSAGLSGNPGPDPGIFAHAVAADAAAAVVAGGGNSVGDDDDGCDGDWEMAEAPQQPPLDENTPPDAPAISTPERTHTPGTSFCLL